LNISSVAVDTQEASQQLTTAAEYQRRSGRRAACLLLILAVVAGVVLLAVSFHQAGTFDTAEVVSDNCLDSFLTGIPAFY
jgi:SNARE domain